MRRIMAKALQVVLCTYCLKEFPHTGSEKCPFCAYPLPQSHQATFVTPDYIFYQKSDLTAKLQPETLASEIAVLQDKLEHWARTCDPKDRLAAVHDAQIVMENLLHAPMPPDYMTSILAAAKMIGNLADAIDRYYRSGGAPYDRKIGQVRPERNGDEADDEAADGRWAT